MKPVIIIAIAVVVVGLVVLFIAFPMEYDADKTPVGFLDEVKEKEISDSDAYLASIEASYREADDRLLVNLILENKNAEYTKADGNLVIRVLDDSDFPVVYEEYDVTRDDFFSWKDGSGEKVTGYRIDVTRFLASGSYDVYVDFTTKSGTNWTDLHAGFYSFN